MKKTFAFLALGILFSFASASFAEDSTPLEWRETKKDSYESYALFGSKLYCSVMVNYWVVEGKKEVRYTIVNVRETQDIGIFSRNTTLVGGTITSESGSYPKKDNEGYVMELGDYDPTVNCPFDSLPKNARAELAGHWGIQKEEEEKGK